MVGMGVCFSIISRFKYFGDTCFQRNIRNFNRKNSTSDDESCHGFHTQFNSFKWPSFFFFRRQLSSTFSMIRFSVDAFSLVSILIGQGGKIVLFPTRSASKKHIPILSVQTAIKCSYTKTCIQEGNGDIVLTAKCGDNRTT